MEAGVSSSPPDDATREVAHGPSTRARVRKLNIRLAGPEWV
jgi:hypothetical protein